MSIKIAAQVFRKERKYRYGGESEEEADIRAMKVAIEAHKTWKAVDWSLERIRTRLENLLAEYMSHSLAIDAQQEVMELFQSVESSEVDKDSVIIAIQLMMNLIYYLISRARWKAINDILNCIIDTPDMLDEVIVLALRCTYPVKDKLKAWDFLLTKAAKHFGQEADSVLEGLLSETESDEL